MNNETKSGITKCSECEKMNIAMRIYNMFAWKTSIDSIAYDKKTEEILIGEKELMNIIQLINPCQKPKKIRIIPSVIEFKRQGVK